MWYIYTREYDSAIKMNAFESVLMRWMSLEPIIQSEVSQEEKDKYRILTSILSAAERSYPTSEVRGRSWEDPMPEGQLPRGLTPRLRSGAAAESVRLQRRRNGREVLPKSEVRGGGREELPRV